MCHPFKICFFVIKYSTGAMLMNYNLKMEEQIMKAGESPRLLLHVCCAPCSSSVLERLGEIFEITCLFYNPNITEEEEYQKRLLELQRFVGALKTKYKVSILEGRYQKEEFFEISKGLEKEPERGKRCLRCYQLRLEETARLAEEYHYPFFATTLTLSPYKNSDAINEIGKILDEKYQPSYLYSDFKKKNGYKRSIELSLEYHLYRQDYCGCIYSKLERMAQKEKNSINYSSIK